MLMRMQSPLRRTAFFSLFAFIALLLTLAGWWMVRDRPATAPARDLRGSLVDRPEIRETEETVGGLRPSKPEDIVHNIGFKPQDVLGNSDCRLHAGREAARDTALVVMSGNSGARLGVLNGSGTVFGAELPFVPHHFHLGRRADGSVGFV